MRMPSQLTGPAAVGMARLSPGRHPCAQEAGEVRGIGLALTAAMTRELVALLAPLLVV